MGTELSQILAVLAERFGTTVEHLWGVILWQVVAEGWMGVAGFGAIAVVLLVLLRWAAKEGDVDDVIISSLLSALVLAVSMPLLGMSLLKILNPEYYALKIVLEALAR
jgi:hypothetical protein